MSKLDTKLQQFKVEANIPVCFLFSFASKRLSFVSSFVKRRRSLVPRVVLSFSPLGSRSGREEHLLGSGFRRSLGGRV